MTWATAAVAGASLLGGVLGSSSAKKAAATQAAAAEAASKASLQGTRETNALTADIYRQSLQNQNPNLIAGQTALSALQSAMGLGALRTGSLAPGVTPQGTSSGYLTNASGQLVDNMGNIVQGQSGLGNIQTGATQNELNAAASGYTGALQGEYTGQDVYQDPSYQFRLSEGMKALRAQQAAGGNRYSGQSMKDIVDYGQGAASQEYGNAYNRYMLNKQALYDRLSNMAGLSSSTANSMGNLGSNAASQIGSNTMSGINASNTALLGGAAAQAAGNVGSTNAIVGGLNNAANNYFMTDYLRSAGRPSGPSNTDILRAANIT